MIRGNSGVPETVPRVIFRSDMPKGKGCGEVAKGSGDQKNVAEIGRRNVIEIERRHEVQIKEERIHVDMNQGAAQGKGAKKK
uniref:Uncharacterized protein n=1 Tax=Steinernema glaseri TaxID=37863 RepID=A0A1I7YKH0_9BILA